MSSSWPEISTAAKENRHELVLTGSEISKRITETKLDKNIFELNLNFLNISDTCLDIIPEEISKLSNLQSLLLYSNKITEIPKATEKLSKLKVLDVSSNNVSKINVDFNKLTQLASINISSNKLDSFPSLGSESKLTVLDLSHNSLTSFPDICDAIHISELKLNANQIPDIPHEINHLASLKCIDFSDNKIAAIPAELSDITKLKEVNLKGNPVSDRRLMKLIDQCKPKQVLDYIRQNCVRKGGDGNEKSKGKGKKGKGVQNKNETHDNEDAKDDSENYRYKITITKEETTNTPTNITIRQSESVRAIRPHILCCIVTGLKFDTDSFRKFIQMQTRLHDTVCEKRTVSTLATHDLVKLVTKTSEESPHNELFYDAKAPNELKLKPLGSNGEVSGQQLYAKLRAEAEALRKEKKRNVYSGIHRYLYMLEGKSQYPCVIDAQGQVISFPPITNSDISRMSVDSTSMFVEATSSTSQDACRKALDQLILEVLTLGVTETPGNLTLHRVRITDNQGNLRAVYPSRTDLKYDDVQSVKIMRE